jgi:glycosyltransferase involved in cell wall biosynthesis
MKDELVSIIIPSFNRANIITATLRSVISQSYTNWECIIIDDNSTDNTKEIIQNIIKYDNRFRLISNVRKKGAQGARNTGILCSNGEWICFLDSDDILLKDSIKDRIDAWKKEKCNDKIGVVYGDFSTIKLKNINGNALEWMVKNMALCGFPTMLVRKNLVFNNFLLDEQFPSWQDDDFIFEISLKYDVLHCGRSVTIISPEGISDSITKSKKRIINGLDLMINKRKNILLKKGGVKRIIIWYIRLITYKIEYYTEVNFDKKHNHVIKKVLNLFTRILKKIYSREFDVIYV